MSNHTAKHHPAYMNVQIWLVVWNSHGLNTSQRVWLGWQSVERSSSQVCHGSFHGHRCHRQWWVCLCGGGHRGAGSSTWETSGADPSFGGAGSGAWLDWRDLNPTDAGWCGCGQAVPEPWTWDWSEHKGNVPYPSLLGWLLQAGGCLLRAWRCLSWGVVCRSAHNSLGGLQPEDVQLA